ncbi:MAG: 50S ribosomal protein L6 [Campylobacterales bacterium]|nr:50S ribosomal protein L6 [Campylobacterales bacterium]
MSRIGKKPIDIPAGVEVKIDGSVINVSKGSDNLSLDTKNNVNVAIADGKITFSPLDESKQSKAFWGTYRALTSNIVKGLTSGFEKKLEITGVGYRAAVKGDVLEMQLGYSHPINFPIPSGIKIEVDKNTISIKGIDAQLVGQTAAKIRGYRPPEPYKGKGIKYSDETIIRKAGKTSKK